MKDKTITLAHGSGGRLTRDLIKDIILKYFNNPVLRRLEDSAEVTVRDRNIAFTTDSYVVNPIFFPGGDIGRLAICGTVNDLAMKGAAPQFVSFSLIIEDGLALVDLEKILRSAQKAARQAGITVVCGDTKVVEKGQADRIFITTSGIGAIKMKTGREFIRPGDRIILSGTVGDHGIAVLNERLKLGLRSALQSDSAPLNLITEKLYKYSSAVRFMRDPTRGGLVSALSEAVDGLKLGMTIKEPAIPISRAVRGACAMLGLDPLYIANEGKFVAVVDPRRAAEILRAIKRHFLGRNAAVIGEVVKKPGGVWLETSIGGMRPLLPLAAEGLPRIC
jgi:hydrogenase expression/formation protein HypE